MYKEGVVFCSLMNCFVIVISFGMQYGVLFEEYVEVFIFICFEFNGFVQGYFNIKMLMSIIDYIFWEFVISYFGCYDLVYVLFDSFVLDIMGEFMEVGVDFCDEEVVGECVVELCEEEVVEE